MPDNSPGKGGQKPRQVDEGSMPMISGVPLLLHALEIVKAEGSTMQERLKATDIIKQYDASEAVSFMYSILKGEDYRMVNRAEKAISAYDPSLIIPLIMQDIGASVHRDRQSAFHAALAIGSSFLPTIEGILDGSVVPDTNVKSKVAKDNVLQRAKHNSISAFKTIVRRMDITQKMEDPNIQNIAGYLFDELEEPSDISHQMSIIEALSITQIPSVEKRLFEYAQIYYGLDGYVTRKAEGLNSRDKLRLGVFFPFKSPFVAREAFGVLTQAFREENLDRITFATDVLSRVGLPERGYGQIPEIIDYLEDKANTELFHKERYRNPMRIILDALIKFGTPNALGMLEIMEEKHAEKVSPYHLIPYLALDAIVRICIRYPDEAYDHIYQPVITALYNEKEKYEERGQKILELLKNHGTREVLPLLKDLEDESEKVFRTAPSRTPGTSQMATIYRLIKETRAEVVRRNPEP